MKSIVMILMLAMPMIAASAVVDVADIDVPAVSAPVEDKVNFGDYARLEMIFNSARPLKLESMVDKWFTGAVYYTPGLADVSVALACPSTSSSTCIPVVVDVASMTTVYVKQALDKVDLNMYSVRVTSTGVAVANPVVGYELRRAGPLHIVYRLRGRMSSPVYGYFVKPVLLK